MSQAQSDHDPLLAFSIEHATAPAPQPPQAEPVEPVALPEVPAIQPAVPLEPDAVVQARERLDRLEQRVEQCLADLRGVKSEVATLVGVTGDIKKRISRAPLPPRPQPAPRRMTRAGGAIAGVVAGVAIAMWLWMSSANDALLTPPPPAPAAVEPSPAPPESAPSPVAAAAIEPAIVPVSAVTTVSTAPPRDTRARNVPPRFAYVGTLSIDADPDGNVFIDRKSAGRTPMRAENLKAGSHLVWIERDGYRRFTRVVQVPADRVTRLVADLEPSQR